MLLICGSKEAGVLGIATVDPSFARLGMAVSSEYDLPLLLEEYPGAGSVRAAFDDDRRGSSSGGPSLSLD